MGTMSGGPFGPLAYRHHPDPVEAINAQLSAGQGRASSSSQGPLPMIAPRPPNQYGYNNAAQYTYPGGYPSLHRANSAASLGLGIQHPQYNMSPVSPRSFFSQPFLGMTASPTQMSQPDLFDFQVTPQQPNMAFTPPERRHTAYARIERSLHSPIVPFTPPIPQPQSADFGPSERTEVWAFNEDNTSLDSEEERISISDIAGLDAHDIGPLVANNLRTPFDLYGTQVRSFHSLADENVLVDYVPSPTDTPLNDPKTAAVFWYFVTVTGPALNPYERNRIDPSRIFSNEPIPKSHQHIWSCKPAGPSLFCRRTAKPTQMSFQYSHSSTRPSFKQFLPSVACRWLSYQGILRLLHGCTMASVFGGMPKIIRARVGERSRLRWLPHCCLPSMKSGSRITRNGALT